MRPPARAPLAKPSGAWLLAFALVLLAMLPAAADPMPARRAGGSYTLGTLQPGVSNYPTGGLSVISDRHLSPSYFSPYQPAPSHGVRDLSNGDWISFGAGDVCRWRRSSSATVGGDRRLDPVEAREILPGYSALSATVDSTTGRYYVLYGGATHSHEEDSLQLVVFINDGPDRIPRVLQRTMLASWDPASDKLHVHRDEPSRRLYVITKSGAAWIIPMPSDPLAESAPLSWTLPISSGTILQLQLDHSTGFATLLQYERNVNPGTITRWTIQVDGTFLPFGTRVTFSSAPVGIYHIAGHPIVYAFTTGGIKRVTYDASGNGTIEHADFLVAQGFEEWLLFETPEGPRIIWDNGTDSREYQVVGTDMTLAGFGADFPPPAFVTIDPAATEPYAWTMPAWRAPASTIVSAIRFNLGANPGEFVSVEESALDWKPTSAQAAQAAIVPGRGDRFHVLYTAYPGAISTYAYTGDTDYIRQEFHQDWIRDLPPLTEGIPSLDGSMVYAATAGLIEPNIGMSTPGIVALAEDPATGRLTFAGYRKIGGTALAPTALLLAEEGRAIYMLAKNPDGNSWFARVGLDAETKLPISHAQFTLGPVTEVGILLHMGDSGLAAVVTSNNGRNGDAIVYVVSPGDETQPPSLVSARTLIPEDGFALAPSDAIWDDRDDTLVVRVNGFGDGTYVTRWEFANPANPTRLEKYLLNSVSENWFYNPENSLIVASEFKSDYTNISEWNIATGVAPARYGFIATPSGYTKYALSFRTHFATGRGLYTQILRNGTAGGIMRTVALTQQSVVGLVPVEVTEPVWTDEFGYTSGVDGGNLIFGIYEQDEDDVLNLRWQSGRFASQSESGFQSVETTGEGGYPIHLEPGRYWLAWNYDFWPDSVGMVSTASNVARKFVWQQPDLPQRVPIEHTSPGSEWALNLTVRDGAITTSGISLR